MRDVGDRLFLSPIKWRHQEQSSAGSPIPAFPTFPLIFENCLAGSPNSDQEYHLFGKIGYKIDIYIFISKNLARKH